MLSLLSILFISFFLALLHIGALLALIFFFRWDYFVITLILWQFFAFIGISICYHREITHRSFKSCHILKIFHLLCAMIAGQAGPIMWAQVHRIHHKYSDKELDPHYPLYGGLWHAHLGWLFNQKRRSENPEFQIKFKDLHGDPCLRFFQYAHFPAFFIIIILLYIFGGWPYVLWFGCLRVVLTLHSAWVINSLGHYWGYQNYEGMDQSRNSKLIAFFTGGEGFHNNHHYRPYCVNMNHRVGEFDPGLYYIRIMKSLGLAYDIKEYRPLPLDEK